MSQILVQSYFNELDRLKKYSGSLTEGVISEAFKDLLKAWSRQENLIFLSQYEFASPQKNRIRPDGTIVHDLRVPFGYWEAKDTHDDLETEIRAKLAKGYPQDNIIFENSETAVLIQDREEVMRCDMHAPERLAKLMTLFFSYERKEIKEFRQAVAQFSTDLPVVLTALRDKIDAAYQANAPFKQAAANFLALAKQTINPAVTEADIREMLIQHILTEEIFAHVFNDGDFHRENNIAKELYALEAQFFTGAVKRDTLRALEPYYAAIRANAAQITNHSEKQTFLKLIYERFYKVYNPKAADRLGVVYTPNEIVKFMIEGADWLCHKHFGKMLIDRDVEILDPATGTGTFICELLEHFRGQPHKLAHKYKEELHANEVAILPYYVANLNIEASYAAIAGQYAEYPNLCFVDTLDNVEGLGIRSGHQHDLFGALSDENVERIKRQNRRKISVVIGNPPYNANQQNENDNNKNREYREIDARIKDSYIKASTAQKTKLYDMYARFFRWASDRMHDDGVLAFVTNRSFIESRTFDGFRKIIADEFAEIYVIDLGGDVRANPKLSGTKNNVFGIQTGVAISFMVKRRAAKTCKIFYARRPEMDTIEDKLAFLSSTKASNIPYEHIKPDAKSNWLGQTDNDWDSLIPVADKATKAAVNKTKEKALFKFSSLGVATNRDEWVYDFDKVNLKNKATYILDVLSSKNKKAKIDFENSIKWSESLKIKATSKIINTKFESENLIKCCFRPFLKYYYYANILLSDRLTENHFATFGEKLNSKNICINIYSISSDKILSTLASRRVPDLGFIKQGNGGTFYVPRYRYTTEGERIDNITDWGLKQFTAHYPKDKAKPITKDAIFHYTYGVLHDPVYREKYALNLKRDFPRLPFYPNFWAWADWGEKLMALHIGYEAVAPWPIVRLEIPDTRARAANLSPKPILKSDKDTGIIRIDSETTLTGIPLTAFDYKLGNRSGIDWILDQYKEKTPKDPTIREKFNTYRFADYKEKVIDLIARVTRVSVETVEITQAMKASSPLNSA